MTSGIETPKELQSKIWRAINIDKMFFSQAAKKFGVHRKTVIKYSKAEEEK